MGKTRKIVSVLLRFLELASAAVVAGLVGNYLFRSFGSPGSRVVYTEAIAGISIVASLALAIPMHLTFYAFPFDFALFLLWIVDFGLLISLNTGGCDSIWYYNNWGYSYYGIYNPAIPVGLINDPVLGTAGCTRWRTNLAFTFISAIAWLMSGLLGVYVISTRAAERKDEARAAQEISQAPLKESSSPA